MTGTSDYLSASSDQLCFYSSFLGIMRSLGGKDGSTCEVYGDNEDGVLG